MFPREGDVDILARIEIMEEKVLIIKAVAFIMTPKQMEYERSLHI